MLEAAGVVELKETPSDKEKEGTFFFILFSKIIPLNSLTSSNPFLFVTTFGLRLFSCLDLNFHVI